MICDDFLRVWRANFGASGAKNDIQIMERSELFNKIRNGDRPLFMPGVDREGFWLHYFYFLCDGIYNEFKFLVSSVSNPGTQKEL